MTASTSITFYDIASTPPLRTFAPNPFKTRLALNIKQVNYKTHWTPFLDITATRKSLGAAANRKHGDGSDFYTLPVIVDHAHSDRVIGDSLEIALYLDKTYPESGTTLVRAGTAGLTAAFNTYVDITFTSCVGLCTHGMPLAGEDVRESFVERARAAGAPAGVTWEDLGVVGEEERKAMFAKLKDGAGSFISLYGMGDGLAALLRAYGFHDDGVFLEGGDVPTYSDVIVTAWLMMFREAISKEEWEDMCTWHDGIWGRLVQAMEKYTEMK